MYLDIDGVLSVWDEKHACVELSRGYGYLMRFCKLHEIQPYWLSMWCDHPEYLTGVSRLLWPDCTSSMASPILTKLEGKEKSDCVDYASDFVWIEDGIGDYDVQNLKQHNALHRFFYTNGRDADCLHKFIDFSCQIFNIDNSCDYHSNAFPDISRPKHPDMV